MRRFVRIPVLWLLVCLCGAPAFGHPLGNYSTNQYLFADLRGEPALYYLLDLAEIPAFQELQQLDLNGDEEYTEAELTAYLDARLPELYGALRWRVDGAEIPLEPAGHRLRLLPGLGGMMVMNIVVKAVPAGLAWPPALPFQCEVESTLLADVIGVRECKIVVDGLYDDRSRYLGDTLKYQQLAQWDMNGNGIYQDYDAQFWIRIEAAKTEAAVEMATPVAFDWTYTARAAAASGELAIQEGLAAALDLHDAGTLAMDDGAEPAETEAAAPRGVSGAQADWVRRLSDIVHSREIAFPVFVAGLAIAAAMGMGHALSPGHGKTVMAAYLIGERGTYLHAIGLGLVVTATHTWSIILFGTGILYAGQYVVPESVEFWSGVASGAIILVIGLYLFLTRYRSFVLAAGGQGHGPAHGHALPAKAAPGYGGILWLGISGGIVPCPAALIVLLLAIKADRVGYGLCLILAFSAGLAAVLVAIGLVIVKTGGAVRKRMGERPAVLLALPVFTALLIALLGGWVIVWTLIQFNVLIVLPAA